MRINRLAMIAQECTRDLKDEGALNVLVYYRHDDKWWSLSDKLEVTGHPTVELNACLTKGDPYRIRRSRYANFPLQEVSAVIRVEFGTSRRSTTLAAIQRVALRSARNGSNAFAVKYNPMTGLLAKGSFKRLVAERLGAMSSEVPSIATSELLEDEANPPALCLLALDIDHFKQTNDSYGHMYGDLVIKAFALRIEGAAERAGQSLGVETACAHVSGEEFFCVAWGRASSRDFEALAEAVRQAVSDSQLPSEEDIHRLQQSTVHVTLPDPRYRHLQCSIGAVVVGPPNDDDHEREAERLIGQADLALYTSKNQGRNRVTFHSSILKTGGRVIEHRADVGICIIDIGKEVGVVKGQEFLVLHPEFAGETPYAIDDGRTRKTLGTLPRVPLCSITAFDVQRQVTFCRFSEERFVGVTIPKHARLEAIPLGTLSALVGGPAGPAPDEFFDQVESVAKTKEQLTGKLSADSTKAFVVVRVRREAEVLSEFGPSTLNRILALACRKLHSVPKLEFLGQLEPTQILLRCSSSGPKVREALESALVATRSNPKIELRAGVFEPSAQTRKWYGTGDVRACVDLARYAASDEAAKRNKCVIVFDPSTAEDIVQHLRYDLKQPQRGLADYRRFAEIGVQSAGLVNAAGLCASALADPAGAETLYLQAAALEPLNAVYRLNAIVVQMRQGNIADAARTARDLARDFTDDPLDRFPFGVAQMALALAEDAKGTNGNAEQVTLAVEWLNRASSMDQTSDVQVGLDRAKQTLVEMGRAE